RAVPQSVRLCADDGSAWAKPLSRHSAVRDGASLAGALHAVSHPLAQRRGGAALPLAARQRQLHSPPYSQPGLRGPGPGGGHQHCRAPACQPASLANDVIGIAVVLSCYVLMAWQLFRVLLG